MSTIRCISLWQPWATLMVTPNPSHPLTGPNRPRAHKTFETRAWGHDKRGLLLIHAAKRWEPHQRLVAMSDPFQSALGLSDAEPWAPLPLGCIVGAVRLDRVHETDALRHHPAMQFDDPEWVFGDFSPGRFAWECYDPLLFAEAIPYRGMQGIFNVPSTVLGDALNAARAAQAKAIHGS